MTGGRSRLQVRGIVQGVGFRPLVFRLAGQHQIRGYVCNQRGEVTIEAEGSPEQLRRFTRDLWEQAVAPARIDSLEETPLPVVGYTGFVIKMSEAAGGAAPAFPPDLAVCPACLSDVADAAGRFADYPFTSCTYCGPRFSLIRSLPYDRGATTMAGFALCEACQAEYQDPRDRRFHAQISACPRCGPSIALHNARGNLMAGDWLRLTQAALLGGEIAAVKGIGGFHLLCDARQAAAVERLRARKRRPRKPLALMVRDLATAEQHFELSPREREALQDRRAAIILLKPKPTLAAVLPLAALAPGHQRLGVMLPYTPLHALLCSGQFPWLVATSGNRPGLPIARTNEEALTQLAGLADLFVLHNRDILVRVEDSVCQVVDEELSFIRRSRGHVPETLPVPLPTARPAGSPVVLAAGAEQKNTFCLLQQNQALLSQHIGEIDNVEQLACWHAGIRHATGLLGVSPAIIAYDPHPGYLVSQAAKEISDGTDCLAVYHHHAHMAAGMAEHGLDQPVIGCILDGTGYGRDGTLWGFELLVGDYVDFERVCHLQPFPLPGGEAAIRRPWLAAVALWHDGEPAAARTEARVREFFPQHLPELPLVLAQLDGRIPSPRAGSAGRLFDAVAAMLGLCTVSSYEGEAAILLGEAAEAGSGHAEDAGSYPVVCRDGQWQTAPLIEALVQDLRRSLPRPVIARRFHHTVAAMICGGALATAERTGVQAVVLGGGTWNNRYLLSCARRWLERQGLRVYAPRRVPAGDGGIALGQAVSALWRWHRHVSRGSGAGA